MIFLPFLHFFAFIACIFLAIFVFVKNRNSLLNRACAALMICYALWNLGDVIVQNSDKAISIDTAIIMQNIASIGWCTYSSVLLCFSVAFTKNRKLLKNKAFLLLIILVPLFFTYLQLTNRLTINPVRTTYGWVFSWANNIWTFLFYFYFSSFTLVSILLVYLHGKNTTRRNEKKQARIIVFIFILGTIVGTLLDIVFQQDELNSTPPVANLMVFLLGSGILYSIYKYRFLTITATFAAENIVSAMDEILILLNQEGLILSVNKATLTTLKYEQNELVGNMLTFLLDNNNQSNELIRNTEREEAITNKEIDFLDKNGRTVPIIYSSTPLTDYEGIFLGTVFIARDITEHKQIEIELRKAKEKAEESDRLKTAFLANMSHEIRTPMNGILGFADLLKKPNLTGEEQSDYITMIEKSGARMLNIVNDIVDISKIESGQMKLNFKTININNHLKDLQSFFLPEATKKGLHLTIKTPLPINDANITTDNEKLYGALTNLIKNAIKYTDAGKIEIGYKLRTDNNTKTIEFYIQDTGIGIQKDRHEAVFNRFIQADISNRVAYQGAGLGLSISKAYVEMLGGKMWLISEEGKGSTFYFTIPYYLEETLNKKTEPEIVLVDKSINIEKAKEKLKILIVEDDEGLEFLLSETVEDYCSELFIANNGEEAVDICRANPDIDLILMDIRMPKMDGYEATEEIRKFNNEVVIIAQTACAFASDHEKALEIGCNDYVSKPIDYSLLNSLIKKHINFENT